VANPTRQSLSFLPYFNGRTGPPARDLHAQAGAARWPGPGPFSLRVATEPDRTPPPRFLLHQARRSALKERQRPPHRIFPLTLFSSHQELVLHCPLPLSPLVRARPPRKLPPRQNHVGAPPPPPSSVRCFSVCPRSNLSCASPPPPSPVL
jgi:hypothetical protein